MELVGAGRELLHSANRSRLVGADEVASELALVAHQVVLRDVVEIGEGERVAVADRDRRCGVVHRGRVGVVLRGAGVGRAEQQRRQRGGDERDETQHVPWRTQSNPRLKRPLRAGNVPAAGTR